jgi:integrase
VRLPRFLCEELGAHLAGQPHERAELVFAAPKGGPLRHSDFIKRKFRPAVTAAGLDPTLRFHDLRHTCASLLIREGASVKAVQKTLGHKSATVTLDRYGHLFPDELESVADRLDRARTHALTDPGRTHQVPPVAQLGGRVR